MARNSILLNGKISSNFTPYQGDDSLTVADGWAPWWLSAAKGSAAWKNRQPVFGHVQLDGRFTQQLATPYATHTGGLWQQVPSVVGNKYEFSADGQAWSSEDPAPATQLEASDVKMQVGIDPTGGLDPDSPLIVWSKTAEPLCRWETVRVQAEAEANVITVFLKSAPSAPKRQQSIFWRQAELRPIGEHKRSLNIVGAGDTHIILEPERPKPGGTISVSVRSVRDQQRVGLLVKTPQNKQTAVISEGKTVDGDHHIWQYRFDTEQDGLYEVRFVTDGGARLLSLRLLRVVQEVQLVPSSSRLNYKKVYVLLPPTSDEKWLLAAARGGFNGRFTIGFSADDAGIGDFAARHVIAVNPHHWPEVITHTWFETHYPGVVFTPIIANQPEDLEAWLKSWTGDL